MEVTLVPMLGGLQKNMLRNWLISTLNSGCENSTSFPISGRLSIYVDGVPRKLQQGSWCITSDNIYLAKEDQDVPLSEQLPILLTLSTLCEPSEELTRACSKAITNYLLGEYRSLSSNLIASAVPPSGIAFSCDNRVASLLGTEWMLPSGEVVDVSGPDWVVCASEVPVRSETPEEFDLLDQDADTTTITVPPTTHQFTVGDRVSYTEVPGASPRDWRETGVVANTNDGRLDIRSDATGFIWSFDGFANLLTLIEPIATTETTEFVIGQRVHWNGGGFGEHDGVISRTPTPSQNFYVMTDAEDQGRVWACAAHELTPLPINAEYQFTVGQRVHWTPNDPDTEQGDGVIESVPDEGRIYYQVRLDGVVGPYWAILEELRAI